MREFDSKILDSKKSKLGRKIAASVCGTSLLLAPTACAEEPKYTGSAVVIDKDHDPARLTPYTYPCGKVTCTGVMIFPEEFSLEVDPSISTSDDEFWIEVKEDQYKSIDVGNTVSVNNGAL